MPAQYVIDQVHELVRSTLTGVVTEDDVREHYRGLRENGAFLPAYRQLIDLRAVTHFEISTAAIERAARLSLFSPHARRAVIVSDDTQYGLARLFATYAGFAGQTMEVFRDSAAAMEWLES